MSVNNDSEYHDTSFNDSMCEFCRRGRWCGGGLYKVGGGIRPKVEAVCVEVEVEVEVVCVSFAKEADARGLYKGGGGLRPKVEAGRASQRVDSTTGLRDREGALATSRS